MVCSIRRHRASHGQCAAEQQQKRRYIGERIARIEMIVMGKEKIITAAIVAVMLLASAGAVVYYAGSNSIIWGSNDSSTVGNTYSITYVLDGGTNSSENPTSYVCGTGATLYSATKSGYIFAGWYTDSDLTDRVYTISTTVSGNLTLYAAWSYLLTGQYLTYSVSGKVVNGFSNYTVSGTCTYKYLSYDSSTDAYYVYMTYSMTYTQRGTSNTDTGEKYYWTGSDGYTWTDSGRTYTLTYNGESKTCEIIIGTSSDGNTTETQYIGDGWIPYKITSVTSSSSHFSSTTSSYTYTLTANGTFDNNVQVSVKAYADTGITVTGSGTYNMGESVTLTATVADGTTFKGWYDSSGNALSSSTTYTFTVVSNMSIYAENSKDPDYTFDDNSSAITLNASAAITSATWTIIDSSGSTVATETSDSSTLSYTFTSVGTYTILVTGTDSSSNTYYGYYTIKVDGDTLVTYTWTFDSTTYSTSLSIDSSDVETYANNGVSRSLGTSATDAQIQAFVTSSDKYVKLIAAYISNATTGKSDEYIANVILAFTQDITYAYDINSTGQEDEYWKYPLETLYDNCGDCEDTAILFCAIGSAMGYKTAVFVLNVDTDSGIKGHAAAGIALSSGVTLVSSSNVLSYTENSVKYYYCETTASTDDGCYVGYNPTKLSGSSWNSLKLLNLAAIAAVSS